MKRFSPYLLSILIGLPLAGCVSSDTPQASAQLTKDFKGGPMPKDFANKFQEGIKKSQQSAKEKAQKAESTK